MIVIEFILAFLINHCYIKSTNIIVLDLINGVHLYYRFNLKETIITYFVSAIYRFLMNYDIKKSLVLPFISRIAAPLIYLSGILYFILEKISFCMSKRSKRLRGCRFV